MKDRIKNLISVIPLGITVGFIVGFIVSICYILTHGYIQYKMWGLIVFQFQESLNKWVLLLTGIPFAIVIVAFLSLLITKRLWNLMLSPVIDVEFYIKNNKKLKVLMSCLSGCLLFVVAGWIMNHYWLPGKFQLISLLCDFGLLIVTIFVVRILIKEHWRLISRLIPYARRASVVFVLLFVLLNGYSIIDRAVIIQEAPNIVLISIETTRADHLSCYGYERETSPTIDKLANEGALFSNMFVQRGLTWPSLASVMTSLYPISHGVRDNGDRLSPSVLSLAEILQNSGYHCGAFLATAVYAEWRGFNKKAFAIQNDKAITQKAIKWLRRNAHKRIFLWLHYWEPHRPYQPLPPYNNIFDPDYKGIMDGSNEQMDRITLQKIEPSEADLNHIIALYDGSILFIDEQIKQLLTVIEDLGIERNSLIIVTADHGEDLYDHNFYFYHAASVYDSSLHVPCIIKFPRNIPKKIKIDSIAESIDIAPTILEFANIKVPDYFAGKSLIPLIFSEEKSRDFHYAYSEWRDKILSVRTATHRYIFNPSRFHPRCIEGASNDTYPIEKEELYDIIKDPRESNNIISNNPEISQKLMKTLLAWNHFNLWLNYDSSIKQKLPEHIKEHLRSLGYIK